MDEKPRNTLERIDELKKQIGSLQNESATTKARVTERAEQTKEEAHKPRRPVLVAVVSVLLAIGPLLLIAAFFRPDLAPIAVQDFVFSVTGGERDAGTDAGTIDEEPDAGVDAGADAGRRRGHGHGTGRDPEGLDGLQNLGGGDDPLDGL